MGGKQEEIESEGDVIVGADGERFGLCADGFEDGRET